MQSPPSRLGSNVGLCVRVVIFQVGALREARAPKQSSPRGSQILPCCGFCESSFGVGVIVSPLPAAVIERNASPSTLNTGVRCILALISILSFAWVLGRYEAGVGSGSGSLEVAGLGWAWLGRIRWELRIWGGQTKQKMRQTGPTGRAKSTTTPLQRPTTRCSQRFSQRLQFTSSTFSSLFFLPPFSLFVFCFLFHVSVRYSKVPFFYSGPKQSMAIFSSPSLSPVCPPGPPFRSLFLLPSLVPVCR